MFCDYAADTVLTVRNVWEIHEALRNQYGHQPLAFVCTLPPGLRVDKDARLLSVQPEIANYSLANAIVCKSIFHQIAGNLYIYRDKPITPTRLFREPRKAINWAKKFIPEEE